MNKEPIVIFWFRRDLRLTDNAGLYHALRSGYPVLPLFIFDQIILDRLEDKDDARVSFIYDVVKGLHGQLREMGSTLLVKLGKPAPVWKELMRDHDIRDVYLNHDYEPYATDRDNQVRKLLAGNGIGFKTYQDQAIFDKEELTKEDGGPYTVFTPYKSRWLKKLESFHLKEYPTEKYFGNFSKTANVPLIPLEKTGFKKSSLAIPGNDYQRVLADYAEKRDYPALDYTSHAGIHLRFGTLSIREMAAKAKKKSDTFLSELIWRDFYFMILWNFPYVANGAFKPAYNNIEWRNNEREFDAWREGRTGYPLVDAGMRQLATTGFMHNRLRMVTASFLAKHLLIDWRWGEAWFARKLLDFELANNNGGWQWSAGTGCDAAPYFRIFNPYEQARKFDPDNAFIRKWVPEVHSQRYPGPIVDHKFARERCLKAYRAALRK